MCKSTHTSIISVMSIVTVAVIFLSISLCNCEDSPTVSTRLGRIKGHYRLSNASVKYEAYEGIPFALPPTGERRFRVSELVHKLIHYFYYYTNLCLPVYRNSSIFK